MGDDEARYAAMVEFVGCFTSLSGPSPIDIAELSDGVALFEAMSEIAPTHFDPSMIARNLEGNWALKSSNLRKFMRNVETYYHEVLRKDADFDVGIADIARKSNKAEIAKVFELVAAAAVTCENRGDFVGRIMSMTPDGQTQMKKVIESSLSRLSDYEDNGGDEEDGERGEGELVFDDDDEEGDAAESEPTNLFQKSDVGGASASIESGDEELRKALQDARREIASLKSQAVVMVEDSENSQKKLRALAEDLQDRLEKRQDELSFAERETKATKIALEDAEARAQEFSQKNAALADELDVANSKAAQLRKAEATVVAYRKKLEGVGVMSQQMTELEDQSATYLRQIMDLEAETKKVPTLQKSVEDLQSQLSKMEKEKLDAESALESKSSDIGELKNQLRAAEDAKKMFEDEIQELRAQQGAESEGGLADEIGAMDGLSLTSAKSVSEAKEKAMRLEIENKKLREELQSARSVGTGEEAASSVANSATVEKLQQELAERTAQLERVASEKVRLESYTKRTLAKFQEKYLVALQECKAKLKEKHDKIEALESRSMSEKSAQKREERLLSSTIYELGISVMQGKLKGSSNK